MNLIEQLGGYERAKHEFEMIKEMKPIYPGEIETNDRLLLEYRRQHNIFEVGDKVIIVQKVWGEDPWDDLCYVFNAKTHHIVGVGIDISVGFGSSQAYRHATDAEIKAGKRLEVNDGY